MKNWDAWECLVLFVICFVLEFSFVLASFGLV